MNASNIKCLRRDHPATRTGELESTREALHSLPRFRPLHFPSPLALQLLALQCMTITLEEIITQQDRLRREIVERECLLAAFDVMQRYMAQRGGPMSMELGSLFSGLGLTRPPTATKDPIALPPAAPTALPAPPPVERYLHPELKAMRHMHGINGKNVSWAIRQITCDYTLRDIAALLEREGLIMAPAEISVVLTRLKQRGEIEEIRAGGGRTPALFRKVTNAASSEQITGGPAVPAPETAESAIPFPGEEASLVGSMG